MSSADDQSEDGELRQSPMHSRKHETLDFSLSDDDVDKMDSLDIKPPQAHSAVPSSRYKRRSDGHSSDRHHKHFERHKERHSHHGKHHRERKDRGEHYQKEKDNYYKEKTSYEQQSFYQHHDMHYVNEKTYREHKESSASSSRHHSEHKYMGKRPKDDGGGKYSDSSSSSKHKNKQESKYEETHGGKTLQDLRARLLSKRSSGGGGGKSDDEYYAKEGASTNEERSRKHVARESDNIDDLLLQGEAGSLVKEIINISTSSGDGVYGSKHGRYNRNFEDKLTDEERTEQDLRREKLLEAEREMARLKEQRERRHIEKQKRRQYEEEALYSKRQKIEDHIVVSDNSEDDLKSDNEDENMREASLSEEDDHDYEKRSLDSPRRSRSRTRSSDRSMRSTKSRDKSSVSRSSSRTDDRSKSEDSDNKSRPSSPIDNQHYSGTKEDTSENSKDMPNQEEQSGKNEAEEEKKELDDDLPPYFPAIRGCRSVEEFQCLNRIAEGTYGVVYRARDKRTNDIVALKRLKMEKEKEGFPITSLREINTLLKGQHANIVTAREIVVGSNMDKIFIVMDYVEHDLKSLMETMSHKKQTFTAGEVKCLLRQLLEAVAHLHDNWILHRDLKTSNLLLSHKGVLKVGDFGLAREYGSPLKPYTPIVVTMWYRAPELLLCCQEYSTPIDIWSVGCIFAELLLMNAIFPGKSEVDQLNRIFKDLGTPNEKIWPGFNKLPAVMKMKFADYPVSNLRNKFSMLSASGLALLSGFLTYDPVQRITAEKALKHPYFTEVPLPIDPAMFPTWPAKSELGHRKALAASPKPPSGGREFKQLGGDDRDDSYGFRIGISAADSRRFAMGGGFNLKF